jgi:hypothetical protein
MSKKESRKDDFDLDPIRISRLDEPTRIGNGGLDFGRKVINLPIEAIKSLHKRIHLQAWHEPKDIDDD